MTSILSGRCFSASSNEFHAGSISIEDYLRDHTGHLFHGARHEQCRGISSDFVARNSEYNVFQAATMACTLRQGEASDPATEEPLISMLLVCETSTWDQIQQLDDSTDTSRRVLSDPSLAQILLARTLMVGNRPLAKDTINNVPAAPDHDLVFSPESISHTHTSVVDGRDFYGHRMFEGQQDNGCDVWIDMLATGWATPRDYMFLSAASSRDETHGRRLFDELVHRGLLPDWDIVHIALVFGQSGFVNLLLDKCIEASGDIPRDAVRRLWMTAVHRDDVWLLKIFSQRGIGSVSTTAGPPRHGTSAPVAQRTPNAPGPLQTLLHEAAECGSPAVVEWLIDHGVANIRNAQGQTAYDSAKGMHGYYVENLHHNRNYPATVKGIEKALEVLEARGFGP